jgi:hypothetical protein
VRKPPVLFSSIGILLGLPGATASTPVEVFVVAGQSNVLNWHASAEALPTDEIDPIIRFFHLSGAPPDRGFERPINASSHGTWTRLGFQEQAPYVRYERRFFGPEMTLARTLANRPDSGAIAVIKIGFFGTNLAQDWRPDAITGNRLHAVLLREVRLALSLLPKEGLRPRLAGFFWMQGETDAARSEHAAAYLENLTDFVASIRSEFEVPALPFVLGRIGPRPAKGYPGQDLVRDAQVGFATQDSHAAWTDTDDLARGGDGIHLVASGVMELGVRWARAWIELARSPTESTHGDSRVSPATPR